MLPTRRELARFAAALIGPVALGGFGPQARAASGAERKFLFLFCSGGWDPNFVFTPPVEGSIVSPEAGATTTTVGGISFVDHADRPSVRTFFERWSDRVCVVNGLEVRSVAHERCRALVLTGDGAVASPDWPSRIAAAAAAAPAFPHLVVAGPAYPGPYSAAVVRVGDDGQLPDLISGAALSRSDRPLLLPSSDAESAADAFLARRISVLRESAGSAGRDAAADFLDAYASVLSRESQLAALSGELTLALPSGGCERDIAADASAVFDAFELGAARCAMLTYAGWCAEGWDTHQDISRQSLNFSELFRYLDDVLSDLSTRPGAAGGSLADEVTLVVFSEMGRAPLLNSFGGRDHWTFTSAMLIGAGVRGGQVVGSVNASALGQPINLSTGEASDSGEALDAAHLGATLLALANLDPGAVGLPIEAVLA